MDPPAKREALDQLFQQAGIRLKRGPLFDRVLSPKDDSFDFQRIEGMLLGVAIGDALGLPTEAKRPEVRAKLYGEIKDYMPYKGRHDAIALPSDDTLMTFWSIEQLLADGAFVPEALADAFCKETARGMGKTVRAFVAARKKGTPWQLCGPASAGNGALMRISPVLLPHLRTGGTDLWVDAALSAMLTHNDTLSLSVCMTFVAMLWELLDMSQTPDPSWWLERYLEIAKPLEDGTLYEGRGGHFLGQKGRPTELFEKELTRASQKKLSTLEACQRWHSGAYLVETWPCVLYILMQHADDPETAIIRAVNDTKDNDTVAAIVGAAVGALHGKAAFPSRWLDGLSGRLRKNDDGAIFQRIAEVREMFWGEN
ncbi:MAG: ADP-ribosylglycohydrolase family protein [Myxococcales bacterium]|nr:ADP-ribosylglycohydrolase family protein [Myxococcales bacterium]